MKVRGRFVTPDNYIRYMEKQLEYREYTIDSTNIRYLTMDEEEIRKILQVCHKVFGSGSIFFGIYENRREVTSAMWKNTWFEWEETLNGMGFLFGYSKKELRFIGFMEQYFNCKANGNC